MLLLTHLVIHLVGAQLAAHHREVGPIEVLRIVCLEVLSRLEIELVVLLIIVHRGVQLIDYLVLFIVIIRIMIPIPIMWGCVVIPPQMGIEDLFIVRGVLLLVQFLLTLILVTIILYI